jgi:aminodeoxyfutalosine synthase
VVTVRALVAILPRLTRTPPTEDHLSHVSELRLRDTSVEAARAKLLAGESLSQEDGVRLFDAPVMELGASRTRWRATSTGPRLLHVNRQLNPTNVCVLACKFCDYAKKPGAPGAYTMTKEQVVAHVDPEITEIHIVGRAPQQVAVRRLPRHHPLGEGEEADAVGQGVHRGRDRLLLPAHEEAGGVGARRAEAAGLDALPGGGAEVFSERVRRELFHQKIGAKRWLEIHEIAHRMGIPATRRCSTATSRRARSACST